MTAMLSKVRFIQSPEIPATLDRMWVEVKVRLADGTVISGKCIRPRAAWGSPISEQDHLVKVRDCLKRALSDAATEEVIDELKQLDRLDADGVRALMQILGGSR